MTRAGLRRLLELGNSEPHFDQTDRAPRNDADLEATVLARPPHVVGVVPDSPADLAGLAEGDLILTIDGQIPSDVIAYQLLIDSADPEVVVERGGVQIALVLEKDQGEPAGIRLSASLFDKIRTCDNKCEFCFIYQLPEGMRDTLYLKDDDYRLSFLYGNFTTLTRFKQADFDRVVRERISPLYVSIHTTDPQLRAEMLSNRKGADSLRWIAPLLHEGIEIHGQVVVCPGVNDGEHLDNTLRDVGRLWPKMSSIGLVPLGVSRYNTSPRMRPMTRQEMREVVELVDRWQEFYLGCLGRRLVFASDEFYLGAEIEFPASREYEDFPQHENGIGMAASLREGIELLRSGAWSTYEAAPATGYRSASGADRLRRDGGRTAGGASADAKRVVVTGELGGRVICPLLSDTAVRSADESRVEVLPVENHFFGGNIAVTGLLSGRDLLRAIASHPDERATYYLPDVTLSEGRFIDDLSIDTLVRETGRSVVVVPTSATGLVMAVEGWVPEDATPTDRTSCAQNRPDLTGCLTARR